LSAPPVENAVRIKGDTKMAAISFLMAVLLGTAAFFFKEAAGQIYLASWAGEVCSTSQIFCHHPEYLAYGGEVLLVLAIGAKLGSLAN
jgi:hypothetical protein